MKKHKRIITLVIAALLVCLMIAGCGTGNAQGDVPAQTQGSDLSEQVEVTAANEQELRAFLEQDANLLVHVSGDMEIREGFAVNGTKILSGDANLKMALGAELGQSMLSVSEGSSLTVDGPVLDCNYNADGIYVAENADLICLSGTVKYAGAYGILTYGDVTIEDISIEDCEFISICAQTGSSVYVKGGSVQRSSSNDIYVVNGAYVNISGDTVMEGALEHAMINYGTLEINGGKFGNVNNYLCDNYGELTVAYKGDEKEGTIEFYGARNSIFLVRKGSSASFSDVYIHDTQRQGIASLGGDTSIVNCKFENTGSHSIDIQGGKASVENVVITGSLNSGLEASNGSEVKVTNFTVNSCENIGIASRGANITATDIHISNTGRYGITCGDTKTGQGVLTVTDAVITKTGAHSIYVYEKAKAELENVEAADGAARGIYVAATATCEISGKSSFKNMAKGGVEVRGTLKMDDVVISNNHTQGSGAGVYVADGGAVTMNNGAVYNNSSALRGGGVCVSNAAFTANGCQIYNNTAVNHGGGLYAQKGAVVTLRTGSLHNNKSDYYGDGIYILNAETNVTMSGAFYLGNNDVKVDNVETKLTITRDGLSWHSESDPLLLTPNYNAPEGTVIATCKSASVAKSVLAASAPGDGSYELAQDGKNIIIKYAVADMDMTGADTVYVSSFEQLKEALETTDSKRNIILNADIVFSERIRLPGGVTINIQDDGTKRTLSRADGFTDSFFVTHYGTGLYLTGTASEMLVMDGGSNASAEGTKLQSLVRAAGSTEIKNVVLQNNGSVLKEHDVRGALVRQLYGDIKIYDSILSGGSAYSGGAFMIDQGKGYVENCVFTGNESAIGGGAIRVSDGCELEVVSSQILENHAGSTGGGIVAVGAAKVTATNTMFENNTAVSYGGALGAQDPETQIKLIGTDAGAVFKNNSSETAGAVYAVKGVEVEISGYTFDGNAATNGRAGAVSILDQSSAIITNTAFYGNETTASGGALSVDGSTAKLISCQFGKEGAGNTAGDKGGAILVMQGSTVEMTVAADASGSVSYNTASGTYGGGAVYVDETSALTAEDYLFEGNQAASGGAIYMAAGANVVSGNNQFTENATVSGNGGAVYCAGVFTDANSSYEGNKAARNGGAIIVMNGGNATLTGTDAVMTSNKAGVNNGGAVFVNGGGEATITGYTLTGNANGSIQVQVNASAELNDLTFTGETGNGIYVNGNLTFDSLTGAHILQTNAGATFTANGYQAGNTIEFTPKEYKAKAVVLTKGEGISDAEFEAACEGITVTPNNGEYWYIDDAGKLKKFTAVSATAGNVTEDFDTLAEAVAFANGKDSAVDILILADTSVNETIEVKKNATIRNAEGKTVTISRGTALSGDMFVVSSGAALTLGSNDAGALIVDGASTAAVAGRTVTVNADAAFTLGENATLQNANSTVDGAAIHTASTKTFVYGTIANNVTNVNCGGLFVQANAKATIDGASFTGNKGGTTAGALYVAANAEVNCQDALFENNKGLKGTKTYVNGGAVYCAGTFDDSNSSYVGNAAKNGGAIIVMSGGNVTLTGTDATKAVMKGNTANVNYGGAVFVNGGGKATITGYTLESNTTGGIQVQASASAELNHLTFTGSTGNSVYVNGSLTFNDLTGVTLVQANAGATFTVSGYQAGNTIEFTPKTYESGIVLTKAADMAEADFQALCKTIAVTQKGDGSYWSIDETGMLTAAVAGITSGGTTEYFHTLTDALASAAKKDTAEIVILENVSIDASITVANNMTIRNAAGKTVTIRRSTALTGDMFVVSSGAALTLGTNDAAEIGKLIIDGASTDAIAGRTVTVNADAAFTLGKNATLQNANSSAAGAAIHTSSINTSVYGVIQNNVSTVDCGGLYVNDNAKATIDGATFSGNRSSTSGSGAALLVRPGAEVTCQNATFASNTVPGSKNGGAIYCAGTFEDTNSTYTGNTAKNGGVIFIPSGGSVTLTGTDAAKAMFKDNKATGAKDSRGGAIFVNGGSASVTGYTFEGNTSTGTNANTGEGAIHVASGSATLRNVVFQGTAAQKTYVLGSLTFENLTGAHIVQAKNGASITVSSNQAGTNIQLTPFSHVENTTVLKKAEGVTDADFSGIAVTQTSDGKCWVIDKDGKLISVVASITADGKTEYFATLEAAVTYANSRDSGEIVILVNTSVSKTAEISKNIAIVNASGKTVTISRGVTLTSDMFVVSGGAALTLGRSDGGALIIDGASTDAIAARTVTVESGAAFTLGKNATLQNANSSAAGAAIHTSSVNTSVYGVIQNNVSTVDCGGLYVNDNAKATIDGAIFSGNRSSTSGSGAALLVRPGAEVTCQNATFANNMVPGSKNGGAIYCAGTFEDTNSTYTGNKAKNGGAIFIPSGGTVTLTGTDAEKAVFTGNQATGATTSKGGAIYVNGGALTVDGYAFTGNTSTTTAHTSDSKNPAIWTASGTSNVTNVTFGE